MMIFFVTLQADIQYARDHQLIKIIENSQIQAQDMIDAFQLIFDKNYYISLEELNILLKRAENFNKLLSPVANLTNSADNEVVVFGDLHGCSRNFRKIFKYFLNNTQQLLFLGDYTDRGDMSLQILTFLLVAQQINSTKVILLRGNHEDIDINVRYGFYDELKQYYTQNRSDQVEYNIEGEIKSMLRNMDKFYDTIVLNAFVQFSDNRLYLATHGGIFLNYDNKNKSLYQVLIQNNKSVYTQVGMQLIWNDPLTNYQRKHQNLNDSVLKVRGRCQQCTKYGSQLFKEFCDKYGIYGVLRGHEVVGQLRRDFSDDSHLTIFSSTQGDKGFCVKYDLKLDKIVQEKLF